jgi:hypothetical protein
LDLADEVMAIRHEDIPFSEGGPTAWFSVIRRQG